MRPPLAIAHIGITVPDLDAAIAWYGDLFGFHLITAPAAIQADGSAIGEIVTDIFGPTLGSLRFAHLHTGNGAVVELFEFQQPPVELKDEPFEWWKGGISHIAVVDPEIDALVERIVATGGKHRTSQIWTLWEGEPYRIAYCEDPWGTVVEVYSRPHHETWSRRG